MVLGLKEALEITLISLNIIAFLLGSYYVLSWIHHLRFKEKAGLLKIFTEYLMIFVAGFSGGMAVAFTTLTGKNHLFRAFGSMAALFVGFLIYLYIRGINRFPEEFLNDLS